MRSISASVFDTAGCVTREELRGAAEVAELVERDQQLQVPAA